ncbi:hypothetical protein Patl1_22513 [Pistacia atlantica]|uniref:Uncharacterized protein n=1 Tax=Pistacia atlantica TaxID=434234 RepID=A0ACC0ZX54_9ROSI|nr:hypothetical protein Patl1_22513 [Pistacia atlantica]
MMSAYYLGIQIVTCSHFHLDYHKPSDPDDLLVQIVEDHHESLQSDFRRSPDDLASRVSETDRQTLRHDQSPDFQGDDEDNKRSLMLYLYLKYKKLALAILFLILEIISSVSEMISSVLDITGKGKLVFIGAALVLAVFAFFATLLVYWKGISTRLPDEKPILNLELLISGTQLFTTLLHLILLLKGDDKCYLPLVPLAFAGFRAFSAYSAFRKKHENGIHNAAEPPAENQVNQHENSIPNAAEPQVKNQVNQHENCIPNAAEPRAENQVNQHDGSRSIMAHMTVTGKPLNMVIDLTMVTCYEQLFRKLRDEMSQAEKVLWGDKSRWNVRYLDISGVTHGLHEDEISWDEFCMAARKIFISRKEVRKDLYRRWESMQEPARKDRKELYIHRSC